MQFNRPKLAASVLLLLVLGLRQTLANAQQADPNFYERPGVTPAEILRARGFIAEEHFITTADGYILKLTRGTSPLFNQGRAGLDHRAPILFVHGIVSDSTLFLINSFDARPKDLSAYELAGNASSLAGEPSAGCLPLLAINCGHEVWLLSRRGTPGSQRMLGNPNGVQPSDNKLPPGANLGLPAGLLRPQATPDGGRFSLQTFTSAPAALLAYGKLPELVPFSLDRKFWNFSYDEQTQYDVPLAIEFVLKRTGRTKLAYVGHSSGSLLFLTTLIEFPHLADNITCAVLWAPAFAEGNGDLANLLLPLEPVFVAASLSFVPALSVTQIQAVLGVLCSIGATQRTICEGVADVLFGPSAGNEPLYAEYISGGFHSTGNLELAQLLQSVRLGGMLHKFDHGPLRNLAVYGQPFPPPYNLKRIRFPNMSLYAGSTDTLVSVIDVNRIRIEFAMPHKYTLLGPFFNHVGYFFHKDTARMSIVPSLLDIQQAD